jgi:predicted nucleic acid-binding protein
MADIIHLVDTSIFIDYFRKHEPAKNWLDQFSQGSLAYSVVTAAELLAGCRNKREHELIEKELALYPMIYVTTTISSTAWEWYREFYLSHNVGFLDCLIGATAYHHGLTICTLNDKHFRPFPNIKVERPY